MPADTPRGLEVLARAGASNSDHRVRRADHADGWPDGLEGVPNPLSCLFERSLESHEDHHYLCWNFCISVGEIPLIARGRRPDLGLSTLPPSDVTARASVLQGTGAGTPARAAKQ